ncbi:hypothetical protein FSP39_010217 [Pinctada imbricata]|uniref:alpha-L-fucosidase n=1 Tax=Pinctada imbricata TaxID=66713 RepID=A0AA89CAD6_PINIB|nr:hypothetical protein FSP39_010217 [Pinctada imbricata]
MSLSTISTLVGTFAFLLVLSSAKRYEPNWESLDSRPNPKWFDDAKIGIFITWGMYAVPAYQGPWFQYWWHTGRKNETEFMKGNYPPGWTYADFAPDFTTWFYDPDYWADVFQDSGIKYTVFVTKHHDGYTLWPSNYSWNWNSMDVGPKRDLVGEFVTSIRNRTDIVVGLYHSLFEFYNPLFLQDQKNGYKTHQFAKQKSMPELYELVNTYKPEVIWSDGDWMTTDDYWNATEFIAWLFNDSPVKDTVLVNDRWGNNIKCKHGSYLTCFDQYNPKVLQTKKWESGITVDQCWSYRREARAIDYLPIDEIMTRLIQIVSCGGNVLVDIGPNKDGMIPPIEEERLRQMGAWLKVNGDAIYKTKPWMYQNDTENSNVWYTVSKYQDPPVVYAMHLGWPEKDTIVLGSPITSSSTQVTLLGETVPIKWTSGGATGLTIQVPVIIPTAEKLIAWTFAITNLKN